MALKSIGEAANEVVENHRARLLNDYLKTLDLVIMTNFRAGVPVDDLKTGLAMAVDALNRGALDHAVETQRRDKAHEESQHGGQEKSVGEGS